MHISGGKVTAVLFAVLMATSLVATPALAGGVGAPSAEPSSQGAGNGHGPLGDGHGPPGHDRGSDANVTIPEVDANSTVELLGDARDRIEALDVEDTDAEALRDETVAAIEASIDAYRVQTFANTTAAFEHQRDALQGLEDLHEAVDADATDDVERASEDVHLASNVSARLTTREAYEAVGQYEDAFRNPGQRQAAESALGNAADAVTRGDDASRTEAPVHYRTAWKQADRALDVVEDSVEPELTLTQGVAFERNDTVEVSVYVHLADVRPYAYDEAAVTVDDGDPETIDLAAEPVAGGSATGSTTVDVGADLENRTVTVTTTSTYDANRTVTETLEVGVDEGEVIPERPDPDEYAEIEVEDDASGVAVEAGGDGLGPHDVTVTDVTPETDDAYRAGPMVQIENRTAIDDATVTMPVDADDLDRDGNLSVYTWDPRDDEPWTPVETEVDRDAGTATAEVDSFSFFSVFWIDEWEDATSDTMVLEDRHVVDGDEGDGEFQKVDLVYVVDVSGSMRGDRIANAREAAKRFTGALYDDEQAGLASFSSSSTLEHELTTDHDALNESIDDLRAGGLTNTAAGLSEGLDELERNGWENRSQLMILLADGHTNRGGDPVDVAEEAAARDVEISTVGLGTGIDEDELQAIADATGGDFYHVEDADDLPETFERVAENRSGVQLRDTNDDGIPDAVAEMDLRMPVPIDLGPVTDGPLVLPGPAIEIDPYLRDTSGDGLADADQIDVEYRVFEAGNETKLEARVTNAIADPGAYDTDGDGLSDYEEVEIWGTDPLLADTSGDGLIDSVDPAPDERTLPPEFEYHSWNLQTATEYPLLGAGWGLSDRFEVVASPTGAADEIEEIRVHQYVDTWVPFKSGWRNETYTGSDLRETDGGDGVYVDTTFGDETGTIAPAEVHITVTDEDGNRGGVSENVDDGVIDVTAGVAGGDSAAILGAGATTHHGQWIPRIAISKSVASSGVAVGGLVLVGGAYALVLDETTGSVHGEFTEQEYVQSVPATEPLWQGEIDGHELTLPRGEVYETYAGYHRGFGAEHVQAVAGLTAETVEETVEEGEKSEQRDRGRFTDYLLRYSDELHFVARTTGRYLVDAALQWAGDESDHGCLIHDDALYMDVEKKAIAADQTEYHGEQYGIDLQVDCPHDSEQWVRTTGGMGDADLSDVNRSQRGDIAETHAGPAFVEDRGLEVVYLEAPDEKGFDVVAYNETSDEYHIIEAKFKSSSGSVSNSTAWFGRPDKGPQMTDTWIEATIDELQASDNESLEELGNELQLARDQGRTHDELIIVQNDEQNGKTVLSTLVEEDMDIDRVHIVKLEEVID